MSTFIYNSSQKELFYTLESIVLWQGAHALECHHLGNRSAATFASTGWIEAVCERSAKGLPCSTADETHLTMLVNDIWILTDLHRQNKQTAAVSSTLFITTLSQPCYCMEHKHKTIAFFPSLLKSSRPQLQFSAVLLQSLEVKGPSCSVTRVGTPLEQTWWHFADSKVGWRIKPINGAPGWD